jgi:hypothetical protein
MIGDKFYGHSIIYYDHQVTVERYYAYLDADDEPQGYYTSWVAYYRYGNENEMIRFCHLKKALPIFTVHKQFHVDSYQDHVMAAFWVMVDKTKCGKTAIMRHFRLSSFLQINRDRIALKAKKNYGL